MTDTEPDIPLEEPPDTEAEPVERGRCEAETTVGGNVYRCALDEGHDGEHSFQTVEDDDGDSDQAEHDAQHQRHLATVDRWDKYLAKNLLDEYGEDLFKQLAMCPLCRYSDTPGYVVPQRPPDEIVAIVRQLLNIKDPSKLQPDPHSQVCVECHGDGEVKTDSHVSGQESLICVNCKGRGWTPTDEKRQMGAGAPIVTAPAPNGEHGEMAVPPVVAEDPPEVAHLKAQGYIVVPPSPIGA